MERWRNDEVREYRAKGTYSEAGTGPSDLYCFRFKHGCNRLERDEIVDRGQYVSIQTVFIQC